MLCNYCILGLMLFVGQIILLQYWIAWCTYNYLHNLLVTILTSYNASKTTQICHAKRAKRMSMDALIVLGRRNYSLPRLVWSIILMKWLPSLNKNRCQRRMWHMVNPQGVRGTIRFSGRCISFIDANIGNQVKSNSFCKHTSIKSKQIAR